MSAELEKLTRATKWAASEVETYTCLGDEEAAKYAEGVVSTWRYLVPSAHLDREETVRAFVRNVIDMERRIGA